jgi:hypothetical protein
VILALLLVSGISGCDNANPKIEDIANPGNLEIISQLEPPDYREAPPGFNPPSWRKR